MDYPPPDREVRILRARHPSLGKEMIERIVLAADAVRRSPDVPGGLSVRATDEACIYPEHPRREGDHGRMLTEVLESSFAGRFTGRRADADSDAGAVFAIVQASVRESG